MRHYYELSKTALRVIKNEGWCNFSRKARHYLKNSRHYLGLNSIFRNLHKIKITADSGDNLPYKKSYEDTLVTAMTKYGNDYVRLQGNYYKPAEGGVKLIAFYLPQYHPIPENDLWWGTGFTEWTNVTKAVPQYFGHYQPRYPGELGYYDLRIPAIQKRQIELAKQYGLYGFCFHFYWFNGKRLLEQPLEQFLSNTETDFHFCINWANENWTKRWDGRDNEVLIRQQYSEQDDIEFIKYVSKYLKDGRYIKINNKPLLMVYRAELLPDARSTAERWRNWCRENGIGEIYLALSQSFTNTDPNKIGFDAAIEFAPNNFPLRDITAQFQLLNSKYQGKILDYNSAIELARNYKISSYKIFRSLCPSWDNEARKTGQSRVLANSNPNAYKEWLKILCDFTIRNFEPSERLVFINAWNEWAEGAYLEPDRKYGYAYLAATLDVLSNVSKNPSQKD